jgi:undecaprenyl diphosphate synthase
MNRPSSELISSLPILSLPQHVVLVPDGNRRWAKKRGLSPIEGHRAGARTFERILKLAYATGLKIKSLSFWALSLDNVRHRSPVELRGLFQLFNELAQRRKP